MSLREIIRQIITESEEPVITKGKKRITVELKDSSGDFEKLIRWWKQMGDIGHSAVIHCDVEQPENLIKLFCDGDGADRVQSIEVMNLSEDE